MNPYKEAWMVHAGKIHPHRKQQPVVKNKQLPDNVKLASAVTKTARAAAIAFAISKVDGPLPFADVVALTYFSTSAAITWHDYFS